MPRSVRVKRVRQARLRWCFLGLDARVDGFECGFVLACEQRKRRIILTYKTKLGGCAASGTNAWGSACEATSVVRSGHVWTIRARVEISEFMRCSGTALVGRVDVVSRVSKVTAVVSLSCMFTVSVMMFTLSESGVGVEDAGLHYSGDCQYMWSCGCDLERSYDHDFGRLDDEYAVVVRGVDRHDAHGDCDAR